MSLFFPFNTAERVKRASGVRHKIGYSTRLTRLPSLSTASRFACRVGQRDSADIYHSRDVNVWTFGEIVIRNLEFGVTYTPLGKGRKGGGGRGGEGSTNSGCSAAARVAIKPIVITNYCTLSPWPRATHYYSDAGVTKPIS